MNQLDALEEWIADGSLSRAAEAHRLGAAALEAQTLLKRDSETLQMIENAYTAAAYLNMTSDDGPELVKGGTALEGADNGTKLNEWIRVSWPAVRAAVVRLDKLLRSEWSSRCTDMFTRFGLLGRVLAHIPSTQDLARRMSALEAEGNSIAEGYPPTEAVQQRLSSARATAVQLEETLNRTGFSDAVAKFLLSALDGRVPLSELKKEVQDWLRTNNALGAFELRLATPQGKPPGSGRVRR